MANNTLVFEGDAAQPSKTAPTKLTLSLDAKAQLKLVVVIGGHKNVDQQCKGYRMDDILATMTELKDKMCACRDKACGDKVDEEESRIMTELAKSAGQVKGERPSEEMMKKMTDVGIAKMECKMKLSNP